MSGTDDIRFEDPSLPDKEQCQRCGRMINPIMLYEAPFESRTGCTLCLPSRRWDSKTMEWKDDPGETWWDD
jgi:hypothetical protein